MRLVHLALALLVASSVLAHEAPVQAAPPDPKLVEQYRPTEFPDRIVLTWADDPATSQAVTWRTNASAAPQRIEVAVAEDGPGFVGKAKSFAAETEALTSEISDARYHSVVLRGLNPKTQYVYRVGAGASWSAWHEFTTAADRHEPFSFIYFGDAQNDLKMHWSRVIRRAFRDAPNARFLLHAGDLINRADADLEWAEWHEAGGWMNASIPNVPTPGNHEYTSGRLSKNWRPQFTLPQNGVPGLEETCYTIDYQGVRLISLDSNRMHAEQAIWLEKVLADNPNPWTIVTFHHPLFSTAKGRDNKTWRETIQPILDRHRVDLVLQGHDHAYGRSNLVVGANHRTPAGTVYVVSVSGPKMYNLEPQDWMARAAEDTQLYQIIRVEGNVLRYEARTAIGTTYDSFRLTKRRGKPNRLDNLIPATPENRRVPPPTGGGTSAEWLLGLAALGSLVLVRRSVS